MSVKGRNFRKFRSDFFEEIDFDAKAWVFGDVFLSIDIPLERCVTRKSGGQPPMPPVTRTGGVPGGKPRDIWGQKKSGGGDVQDDAVQRRRHPDLAGQA